MPCLLHWEVRKANHTDGTYSGAEPLSRTVFMLPLTMKVPLNLELVLAEAWRSFTEFSFVKWNNYFSLSCVLCLSFILLSSICLSWSLIHLGNYV